MESPRTSSASGWLSIGTAARLHPPTSTPTPTLIKDRVGWTSSDDQPPNDLPIPFFFNLLRHCSPFTIPILMAPVFPWKTFCIARSAFFGHPALRWGGVRRFLISQGVYLHLTSSDSSIGTFRCILTIHVYALGLSYRTAVLILPAVCGSRLPVLRSISCFLIVVIIEW